MRFFFCQAAAVAFWRESKKQTDRQPDRRDEGVDFRVCGFELSSILPRTQRRQECEKGPTVSEKATNACETDPAREREREREASLGLGV
jgi:hypothetical protein